MNFDQIIDFKKTKLDKNGIWAADLTLSEEFRTSQKTWERIYNFNLSKLKQDRADFNENKLEDHISYITKYYNFTAKTVYLEIGCGPSYIGEYLMKKYDCIFVGVDFNYQVLVTLKKYLDSLGYKKYALIHADINNMPIKSNSINYIYGGGVIEHFKNTKSLIGKLYQVLKKDGVAFNTVPAFNLFWVLSSHKNIPSYPLARQLFEFLHIKLLQNKLLDKYHGYELSFGMGQLKKMHKENGFTSSYTGAFAFHPSVKKLRNKYLRNAYFMFSKFSLTCPIIYIAAKK